MKQLQQNLLEWYFHFGRLDLPWRNLVGQSSTPHPLLTHINRAYGVYLSEIMLQQTQVSVVMERYYFPFLQAFPTLQSLAESQESEVLKLWQGLGYYSRARNLRESAIFCQNHYQGKLPNSRKELKKLKGVGEYCSGAIACFGFGEAVSFVDGNIARVLCRLFAFCEATPKVLEQKAQEILNFDDPFNHNQALLDLGATLCTPKNPNCLFCPLNSFCQGKHNPSLYPTPKKSTTIPLELSLGFIQKDQKISLCKSQEKLYFGLYNPIKLESKDLKDSLLLGSFKHSYTKYSILAKVYLLQASEANSTFKNLEFFEISQIPHLPLSNLCKKALQCLK